MKKILITMLLLAFSATASQAEMQSVLKGNDPVKIAVLGMGVYNVVMSGSGLGAAANLSKEAEATNTDKALADGFDFKAVSQYVIDQYKEKLSGVRKWQVVSAKELGKDEVIAKFAQSVKDSDAKIPGSPSADRYKRWTLADGLPFVDAQWVLCVTCDDYQKAIVDAAKKFCADAGVDGVWLQSNTLGYATKQGASSFFSSVTGGSGQATATVSTNYLLIDKDGQIVFSTGKTAEQFRSESTFGMIGGMKAIDKEMMKFQLDAILVSATEIANKVSK